MNLISMFENAEKPAKRIVNIVFFFIKMKWIFLPKETI